jgi:hypothetical protein
MSVLVKNIVRFVLFILVQFFVLDKIHLHKMVTPYIYFLFIIWLPFNMQRGWQLVIAFMLGFVLDSFRHQPGFHTAACVLVAYLRPFLVNRLIPHEGADANYDEPSVKSLGGYMRYFIFITILTVIHHGWLFLLEAWQFGNIWYFLIKTVLSTVVSLALIVVAEMLFVRKQQFRTNTA